MLVRRGTRVYRDPVFVTTPFDQVVMPLELPKERLLLLMADDTPVVLSWLLYRYLMRISASRESRLGNLAAQGEGS